MISVIIPDSITKVGKINSNFHRFNKVLYTLLFFEKVLKFVVPPIPIVMKSEPSGMENK